MEIFTMSDWKFQKPRVENLRKEREKFFWRKLFSKKFLLYTLFSLTVSVLNKSGKMNT